MIFAAGLGTRFKPWTDRHPKALAPVHGKPLLQHNIEYLQRHGIRRVVVNIHHFPDQIRAAVERAGGWGSEVIFSDESDVVLETGGGLLKAQPLLEGGIFLTLNADILTDLDLTAFIEAHRERRPLISLAVTERPTARYFLFDEGLQLCGWRNTATGAERIVRPGSHLRPLGYSTVALFEPEVFPLIPMRGKFSLVEAYLHLAAAHPVLGFDHTGDRLIDVGKPDSVEKAERLFADRQS